MPEAIGLVLVPPPIQGIGNANGFTMQVEMRDGSFDYEKLQTLARTIVSNGNSQSGLQRLNTTFRASVPQLEVIVDRVKAETLNVSVGDVFNVLAGYIGSSYVNQFNKFGRTYQVYVQADAKYRLEQRDIEHLWVRSKSNQMVPLGTLVQIKHDVGPSLVSLYNLYPTAAINGGAAQGFSSGRGAEPDGTDRRSHLTAWHGIRMDGDVLSGEDHRQPDHLCVRLWHPVGLSLSCRPIRELDCAVLRDPRRAAVADGAVHRAGHPGRCEQPLHADWPGAADRPLGEERDPDRRSCA